MSTVQIHDVKKAMMDYFIGTAGVAPEQLQDGAVMVESLGIDSLTMIEMLWDVEEKFGVHIESLTELKDKSLDQLAAYITEQLTSKSDKVTSGQAPTSAVETSLA